MRLVTMLLALLATAPIAATAAAAEEGFVPLFDGKTLTGWRKIGGGDWKIADGAIRGTAVKSEKEHGLLITEKKFSDFAVRLKYKVNKGNSGFYFRSEEGGTAGVMGFQAEIDMNRATGGLYETRGRAWVVKPKPEDVKTWCKPIGQWNEMAVVAIGKRIVVHVNGKKTAELTNDPGRTEGYIALQLHGGQDMDVEFKDIDILEIPLKK